MKVRHAGRTPVQANGGVAAIDLPLRVVEDAGKVPLWFDSGDGRGEGDRARRGVVGVGRPYSYGLALGGADGAAHVLRCLPAEADLLMAVNGWPTLADVRAAEAVRA